MKDNKCPLLTYLHGTYRMQLWLKDSCKEHTNVFYALFLLGWKPGVVQVYIKLDEGPGVARRKKKMLKKKIGIFFSL